MRRLLVLLLVLGSAGTMSVAREDAGPERIGLVRVRGDGPKRLSRARLAALGVRDPLRLELRREGKLVHLYTHEEVPVDPEHLVFVARGTARPHSAFAVYELWKLPKPRALWPVPASKGVPLARGLALDRFHGELGAADPAIYDPGRAPRPHWFLMALRPGHEASVRFGPFGATPGTEQVLEARVHGTWTDLASLEATWNDVPLGRVATPDPSREHVVRWTVPPALVPKAPALLVLRNTSPPPSAPPKNDVSANRGTLYVDALQLRGPATWRAAWDAGPVVAIEPAGAPADPLRAAGRARHVILATPPLLGGARRLAAHRTRTGTPSVAIDVTHVYDRYGHGNADPRAIVAFVSDLRGRKGAPLAWLVLAGDATYDRTDILEAVTIPARMAYTMYNGATPADALYAGDGTEVGRLPFETGAEMDAYVARLVHYETSPPTDPARRMLRFVTSPGRFGAFIDGIIESRFKRVLAQGIPPAYDVSVTYANPRSAYTWPPAQFDEHVIEQLNAGALFFTYVGHGFEKGFDTVRVGGTQHPILGVEDAIRIDSRRMPPVVFVLACTTAMFDGLRGPGIGEALMRRPHGPIAYVGATRVCHPGYNALLGESIAQHMATGGAHPRLGALLATARAHAADPTNRRMVRLAIRHLGKADPGRIAREGAAMYVLLGDPATRVPIPEPLTFAIDRPAQPTTPPTARVTVRGAFPRGARVAWTLEHPRTRTPSVPHPDVDPARAENAARIRANHAAANDLVFDRAFAPAAQAGVATLDLGPQALEHAGGTLKVWITFDDRVLYGGIALPKPAGGAAKDR